MKFQHKLLEFWLFCKQPLTYLGGPVKLQGILEFSTVDILTGTVRSSKNIFTRRAAWWLISYGIYEKIQSDGKTSSKEYSVPQFKLSRELTRIICELTKTIDNRLEVCSIRPWVRKSRKPWCRCKLHWKNIHGAYEVDAKVKQCTRQRRPESNPESVVATEIQERRQPCLCRENVWLPWAATSSDPKMDEITELQPFGLLIAYVKRKHCGGLTKINIGLKPFGKFRWEECMN